MGRRDLLICAGLALAVLAMFIQATTFDFINLDDADYVSGNPHVRGGPTIRNVLWAFRTFRNGNWHPLTWLSHMVDCRLFGVRPGPHHLTNVLLHAATPRPSGGLLAAAAAAIARARSGEATVPAQRSAALFSPAVAVTENNWLAHANLASALALQGRTDEAVAHYEEALRINPGHARSHNNLGFILAARGRLDNAIVQYTEAFRKHPDYALAHDNLGVALARQGRIAEAIAHFREALRGLPDDAAAHYDLANALLQAGSLDEAIAEYSEALRLDPASAPAPNNPGLPLAPIRP